MRHRQSSLACRSFADEVQGNRCTLPSRTVSDVTDRLVVSSLCPACAEFPFVIESLLRAIDNDALDRSRRVRDRERALSEPTEADGHDGVVRLEPVVCPLDRMVGRQSGNNMRRYGTR